MRLGLVDVTGGRPFLTIEAEGRTLDLSPPRLPLNTGLAANWTFEGETKEINPFEAEFAFRDGDTRLVVEAEGFARTPLLRFRYRLEGPGAFSGETPVYLGFPVPERIEETRLAEFESVQHVYFPHERAYDRDELTEGRAIGGPILRADGFFFAHEHGGEQPNLEFLRYVRRGDALELDGHRANVHADQPIDGWTSIAFLAAPGLSAEAFRRFLLDEICPVPDSREPRLHYNTWNHQERVKYYEKRPYLSEMNRDRMLAEIDVAAEMGLETFVIDTGWYSRTGDWEVDAGRFPDLLQDVKKRLEGYGMRLGLWFDPVVAAKTSRPVREHPEWCKTWDGKILERGPIWETEDAVGMCLCTGWLEYFVQQIERLHREVGVTYLKLDGVSMHGCSDPHHGHGTANDSQEFRQARYGFELGRRMATLAEEVTTRIPGTVVDFDITENNRYVGLDFLRVGKYFHFNNGPYYSNFDTPPHFVRDPDPINATFFPGPCRARLSRGSARYDGIVPSVLFLVHGLPDGDERARDNALASLALGGNGLWGSLPELTAEERAYWRVHLARYKEVRHAATRAYPRVLGERWGSPEIHEKIDGNEGFVAFLTHGGGRIEHVTAPLSSPPSRVEGAEEWSMVGDRLRMVVDLGRDGARLVTVHG